jgi:hypothetical protein
VEEQRRRVNDEIFRQMVRVHGESVDSYLEAIIIGATDAVADDLGLHRTIPPLCSLPP